MTFDIRDALLGRSFPEANTPIWVDDRVFYEIEEIQHQIADAVDTIRARSVKTGEVPDAEKDPAVKKLMAKLKHAQKVRDEQAVTVYFRAIDNEENEAIIEEALQQVPIERDMFGREREISTLRRNRMIRELSFAAHMTKLVSPDGQEQLITDENRRDVARAILLKAPPVTLHIIDQAITQINKQFADHLAKVQGTDFLSKR